VGGRAGVVCAETAGGRGSGAPKPWADAYVPCGHDEQGAGEARRSSPGGVVLTTLPPFGFIAPFGFAYAAYRAGARRWYLLGAGWGLLAYVGLAINIPAAEDSQLDGFSSLLMVIAWVGAFVNALALPGEYVRRVSRRRRDPVLLAPSP
jgi:hypothetical protein